MTPRIRSLRAHTLVEVTIAMALGLLILGAALSLYRSQRVTHALATDAARLRDAASMSLIMIAQQVQMAGFVPLDARHRLRAPGLFGCTGARPVGADAEPRCEPLAGGSDGVLVSYIGDEVSTWATADGYASDCLGQGVGPAGGQPTIVNRYYARVSASTGEPELYCEGNGRPGVGQPLVEGVERLRLRYGLGGAGQWVDAASMPARMWAEVVAVEICVQVRGAATGRVTRYIDCDGHALDAADTRSRLVLHRYVAVRNGAAG